jgi:hypothetical protein
MDSDGRIALLVMRQHKYAVVICYDGSKVISIETTYPALAVCVCVSRVDYRINNTYESEPVQPLLSRVQACTGCSRKGNTVGHSICVSCVHPARAQIVPEFA